MPYYYSFTSRAKNTVVRDVFVLHYYLPSFLVVVDDDDITIVVVVNDDDDHHHHFGISCYCHR